MKPFGHLLVPTDFSACSDAALDAAVLLAKTLGADITLIHVVDLQEPDFVGETFVPQPDLVARAEDQARLALDAARAKVPGAVFVRSGTRVGTAWKEILAAAADCGADLIVMGTHGRKGIARVLIGSTTEKIVRLAPAPVLTVHAASAVARTTASEPSGVQQSAKDG